MIFHKQTFMNENDSSHVMDNLDTVYGKIISCPYSSTKYARLSKVGSRICKLDEVDKFGNPNGSTFSIDTHKTWQLYFS